MKCESRIQQLEENEEKLAQDKEEAVLTISSLKESLDNTKKRLSRYESSMYFRKCKKFKYLKIFAQVLQCYTSALKPGYKKITITLQIGDCSQRGEGS